MADSKQKKVALTGQVRLPENLDREIDMEASRLGLFKYQVVERAWDVYLANRDKDDKDPYLAKLRTILETGTERERDAVRKGIDLILSPLGAAASQPVRGRRKAG